MPNNGRKTVISPRMLRGSRRRFRDANPDEIEALTLEGMRAAVMSQLHAGNLEVSVVGDLDPAQLEVRTLLPSLLLCPKDCSSVF